MMRTHATRLRRQRGMGLVEIMIALVISAFLVIGAITVFMQSRSTARTADTASRVQETVRYALDTIEPDVRMANYWGMTNRPDYVANAAGAGAAQSALDALVTDSCGNNFVVDAARYVDGRDGADAGGSGYDLACAGTDPTTYSDVLIVRRASARASALTNGTLQIQSNRIRGEFFSDGARPAGFAAAPASETHNVVVHVYYVGRAPDSPAGLPQWALYRKELGTAGGAPAMQDVEVIRGIQDMQVEFGVDTNGDNSADLYVNPESATIAGNTIVAVRLWLLAVSEDQEQGFVNDTQYTLANQAHDAFDDGRRRVLVQKTIQLRNSRIS